MDPRRVDTAIYLNKRARVALDEATGECPAALVATLNKNLESLGFTLSQRLFERLQSHSIESVARLYGEVVPILQKMVGAHRRFRPMYPNFPAQVMEASNLELYMNAFGHYWGSYVADRTGQPGFIILPSYPEAVREPLEELPRRALARVSQWLFGEPAPGPPDEPPRLRVVELGSTSDFESIFTSLIAANGSMSNDDKAVIAWFVDSYGDELLRLLPAVIPQKETLALLTGLLLKRTEPTFLLPHMKTATDVLRVAVVMSGGDVSLARPTRFAKFTRRQRRFFLRSLESCAAVVEDMPRWKEYWVRLGEILHPFEYKNHFPKACEAFDILRNGKPIERFESMVEAGLRRGEVGAVVRLLSARPGSFARRLDHVLRLGGGSEAVDSFLNVAGQVATPVLVQVYHHFKIRPEPHSSRAFFPKGEVAKMHVREEPLPPLPRDLTESVAAGVRAVLVKRFAALPGLGKVWVDEALKQFMVPFARRSASKSLRTVARGSRLDYPETPVVRFFIWWKNGKYRTDIDLSAVFFSDDWRRAGNVFYCNLRDPALGCYHSGDIVDAPDGACEFIDLEVCKMLDHGVRYVVMSVNSFTNQSYCDLPECFAGWMARAKPQSGEIFEARTVQDKIDLASDTTVSIPVVIDLRARQVVWADAALRSTGWFNNVVANRDGIARLARAIVGLDRPNLYDLFLMHAEARGEPSTRSEAGSAFSIHQGVTPFDADRILGEFLA